ncbi:MAG: hypothetical protein PVI26_11325, partial [Chitinispirillia bacterium]
AVGKLFKKHKIKSIVQPSSTRIYPDKEYKNRGAVLSDDLSRCKVVFGVKEIPEKCILPNKTYVFFSHTIKGQPYNMPMLQRLMDLRCTLIDYEKIIDRRGKRIIFFGRFAGLAGMIDTLWAFGKRIEKKNITSPFSQITPTYQYDSLNRAKKAISSMGEQIKKGNIDDSISPFICGFAGYGNVSIGAQEIFDLLPVYEITPSELCDKFFCRNLSKQNVYKVIFKEEDIVEPVDNNASFILEDYYIHPELYQSKFNRYIPHLSILINANYWNSSFPRLITKEYMKNIFSKNKNRKLQVIGDISCDVEGAVECTTSCTTLDNPVYIYDPIKEKTRKGFTGRGIAVMAVDNLPCELPVESSDDFSKKLMEFVPSIVKADYINSYDKCTLPDPVKKAVIVYKGKLTKDYRYIQQYL